MIFLTVGSQLHFNRLTEMVSRWAQCETGVEVIGQIGETSYMPKNMRCWKTMPPEQYREYFQSAEVVVAHAGTGVTLTAAEFGVPLIMMPRLAELGEMRNNHQVDYLSYFGSLTGIYPVYDESTLFHLLSNRQQLEPMRPIEANHSSLTSAIKDFIWAPKLG